MTLPELLIAVAIMALVAGVMSGLASAVRHNYEHCSEQGLATQHARVALERIGRAVRGAYASENHPGCAIAYAGADPVALLVWTPAGLPANSAGPPLTREVVIFAVDPDSPNQLLEVTRPTDGSPLPLDGSISYASVETLIRAPGSRAVVLTDLLRLPDNSAGAVQQRGLARFIVEMRPTAAELTAYRQNTVAWNQLPWPQGLSGPNSGVRQVRVRIELQLAPAAPASRIDATGEQTLPFLGSAAFSYQVKR
ncbi:MAG: hypothetical protein HY000_25520 [Planctomycetes bacterium]|nr:hypothetical protein [Planctomycetota bacterium]